MKDIDHFIQLCVENNILRFGDFTLKSGRRSPYFFNAGLFNNGALLYAVGSYFADALETSDLAYDMLLGPAYKGIPLVSSTAIALHTQHQKNIPYAYSRKEAKTHGEGGNLVGAPLTGRVIILDDVITAGTAIRATLPLFKESDAVLAGIGVILDRQEKSIGNLSAIQALEQELQVPVKSLLRLDTIIAYFINQPNMSSELLANIQAYQATYGVN